MLSHFVANQSVPFASKSSGQSVNPKPTLVEKAEEQFKIATQSPHQPVKCSSTATASSNQPIVTKHPAKVIPQACSGDQDNQLADSQEMAQNLSNSPENVNLSHSVTEQQPSLQANLLLKDFEQSSSEVVDHLQDESFQTEVVQDSYPPSNSKSLHYTIRI